MYDKYLCKLDHMCRMRHKSLPKWFSLEMSRIGSSNWILERNTKICGQSYLIAYNHTPQVPIFSASHKWPKLETIDVDVGFYS